MPNAIDARIINTLNIKRNGIRNRKTNKPIIDIRITGFLLCIKFKPTNFLYSIRLCIYHLPKSFKKLCVKYSKNTINATVICNL